MTGKPKVQRTRRDPADKAREAWEIADRRVAKLVDLRDALTIRLSAVQAEYKLAVEEADHLAQSPHLTRQAKGDPA